MAILGILIFAFLMIHMGDFWWKLQFTDEPYALLQYAGMSHPIEDVYAGVVASFKNPVVMICYLIGYLALGIHLWHGFQSAFRPWAESHEIQWPDQIFRHCLCSPGSTGILPLFRSTSF